MSLYIIIYVARFSIPWLCSELCTYPSLSFVVLAKKDITKLLSPASLPESAPLQVKVLQFLTSVLNRLVRAIGVDLLDLRHHLIAASLASVVRNVFPDFNSYVQLWQR